MKNSSGSRTGNRTVTKLIVINLLHHHRIRHELLEILAVVELLIIVPFIIINNVPSVYEWSRYFEFVLLPADPAKLPVTEEPVETTAYITFLVMINIR